MAGAEWSCKLLHPANGQELMVLFLWKESVFDLVVVDPAQRVWSKQGARRTALRMLHCPCQHTAANHHKNTPAQAARSLQE